MICILFVNLANPVGDLLKDGASLAVVLYH